MWRYKWKQLLNEVYLNFCKTTVRELSIPIHIVILISNVNSEIQQNLGLTQRDTFQRDIPYTPGEKQMPVPFCFVGYSIQKDPYSGLRKL